jgi:hypothetical protein
MEKYLSGGQPLVGPWGTVYGGNITPDPETGTGNWTENEIKVAFMTGVNKQGRRLILMPWFVYSNLTNEDGDALAYYIKNALPAVKNQVPTASLNDGFTVLAPKPAQTSTLNIPYVIAGVVILVLVIVAILLFGRRKKPAA